MNEKEVKPMKSYVRKITFTKEAFDALRRIMSSRGFPEKKISESEIVCEAILNMSKSGHIKTRSKEEK
ncbi:MAG: hypothetical protein DRN26_02805 [Thermoplasmata archaeon]|nr:MAG: hypothetical protein DRN26_02805 [Thermoplasmata archaeon]